MKKILHITNHIGTNAGGGIKTFIVDLLKYNNEKFENYLVFNGNQEDIDSLGLSNICKVYTFNFSFINRKNKLSIFQLFSLIKSVDVVHQHSLWRLNSLITIISSLFFKKRTIIQPHGALMKYALTQKSKYLKIIYYYLIERFNLMLSESIIVSSKEEANFFIIKWQFDKIKFIPLGVKSDFATNQVKLKSMDKYFKLCYISRIHPIKGLELLIDSVSILENKIKEKIRITIAGNGNDSYVNFLKDRIKFFGLDINFSFIGLINEQEKKKTLDSTDFFILPSFSESFSISTVEALSRGVPVLTSSGTPWKDIFPQEKCGIIFDCNRNSILDAIIESYNMSNTTYNEFSSNAINLVDKYYIFEKNIDALNKLY